MYFLILIVFSIKWFSIAHAYRIHKFLQMGKISNLLSLINRQQQPSKKFWKSTQVTTRHWRSLVASTRSRRLLRNDSKHAISCRKWPASTRRMWRPGSSLHRYVNSTTCLDHCPLTGRLCVFLRNQSRWRFRPRFSITWQLFFFVNTSSQKQW